MLSDKREACFRLFLTLCCSVQSGGFYSAQDADSLPTPECSEKREGAFCVWTAGEVRELLSDTVEGATGGATQADIFMHHYGVKDQGNVELEQVHKMPGCSPSNFFKYCIILYLLPL